MKEQVLEFIDKASLQELKEDKYIGGHIGGSTIGNPCYRAIWYSLHDAHEKDISPRLGRLFKRGHIDEIRILKLLKKGGANIKRLDPATNRQYSFKDDNFRAGSIDGIIILNDDPCILEIKTMNHSSFTALKKSSIKDKMRSYYDQVQFYMSHSKKMSFSRRFINKCVFIVVNKNNDELYSEVVDYDEAYAKFLNDKAKMVAEQDEVPDRISDNPCFFGCKMCSYKNICHFDEKPKLSCKTCRFSEKNVNKNIFRCTKHNWECIDICSDHDFKKGLIKSNDQ